MSDLSFQYYLERLMCHMNNPDELHILQLQNLTQLESMSFYRYKISILLIPDGHEENF